MTIKQRIFRTNSIMVLLSLLVLLLIGGSMILIFKDYFLGWYSQNAMISENYTEASATIQELAITDTDWERVAQSVSDYGFRLIVLDDSGKTVYQTARHSEEESAETLYDTDKEEGVVKSYLIEGTTIFTLQKEIAGTDYQLYFVSCTKDVSILGMSRGMFETFMVIFLIVGVLSIIIILVLSQLMTKSLIKKIMEPLNGLNDAANRIIDGDLDKSIDYSHDDEFKNVCASFDLMQRHLKEQMETNLAYEKARTEMISGISHDLRTPLTSIKGYIKGMMDGIADTEQKRKEYLSVAYKKSCDMDKLLAKLFYFSKLETGNMPFYFQSVDMKQYLEDYVAEKEVELQMRDIVIQGYFDAMEPCMCRIDREQMQRVFDNLIENSCKYAQNEAGVRIEITALTLQEKQLKLTFKDNGAGMEPEKLKHVFEQFYRGDEARNAACNGNGLGMYVCRYIIEKHEGSIEAHSDRGFIVEITLPIGTEGE